MTDAERITTQKVWSVDEMQRRLRNLHALMDEKSLDAIILSRLGPFARQKASPLRGRPRLRRFGFAAFGFGAAFCVGPAPRVFTTSSTTPVSSARLSAGCTLRSSRGGASLH